MAAARTAARALAAHTARRTTSRAYSTAPLSTASRPHAPRPLATTHRARPYTAPLTTTTTTIPTRRSSTRDSPAPGLSTAAGLGTPERLPEFSLAGKVIVVSGGAQGLGLSQSGALLEAGATVYALDRQESPPADGPFAALQTRARSELGAELRYLRADVREAVALEAAVSEIVDAHGRIDGLIAAAGIQQETPALEYTAADARRMLDVNVTGVLLTAQAVAKKMVDLGCPGSLVLIASMSASVANRGLICPVYNASKAAVVQLARNLAAEWGGHGIRVNTISPGYIVTEMVERLFEQFPERRDSWPTQNMLGLLSRPEDYRGAAVFLLSDASRFMTGADLKIDGGHTAW